MILFNILLITFIILLYVLRTLRGNNIKNIIQISIIAVLLFSGLGVVAFEENNQNKNQLEINQSEYDMLIIAPRKFFYALQPLINHKNDVGIQTILETTEDIYKSYNARDKAEEIKLRIKDALEEWNITYVLLVGGGKHQSFQWYIPERKSNCNTFICDHGYTTDLYYSDIYKEVNGGYRFPPLPRNTVEEWTLFGNPSLKIGGYR